MQSVPDVFEAVQRHRQAQAEEQAARQQAAELLQGLEEAAQVSGLSFGELRDRIEHATARGASASLQPLYDTNYDACQTWAQNDEEYRLRQAARSADWDARAMAARQGLADAITEQNALLGGAANHAAEAEATELP